MVGTTENCGLALWEAEDEFGSPGEFNKNYEALDRALAGVAVVAGTHQGPGSAGNAGVTLGFRPRAASALPKKLQPARQCHWSVFRRCQLR